MSRPGLVLVILGFAVLAATDLYFTVINIGGFYGSWVIDSYKYVNGVSAVGTLVALLGFVVMLTDSGRTPKAPWPAGQVGPTTDQRLRELDILHEAGRVTPAEHQAQRARILDDL